MFSRAGMTSSHRRVFKPQSGFIQRRTPANGNERRASRKNHSKAEATSSLRLVGEFRCHRLHRPQISTDLWAMQASGIRRRPDEKCDHGSRRTMLDKLVAAEEKRRYRGFYNEPVIAAGSESCEGKGSTTCSRNGMKAVRSRTSSWNLSKVLR
jgi:hypothetical protein